MGAEQGHAARLLARNEILGATVMHVYSAGDPRAVRINEVPYETFLYLDAGGQPRTAIIAANTLIEDRDGWV